MNRTAAWKAVGTRARLGVLTVMLLTLLAATAAPSLGQPATHSTRPVLRLADIFSGGPPTPVGSSTLVRTGQGVSLRLETAALTAGDVVTLWWVVFNDPLACRAGIPGVSHCGPADAMAGRGGFSVLHAAGRIVGENGTANYGAHLRVGDTARALVGPGLLDARGAEMILVLKTHGPKLPRLVPEQLRTFAGGCADQSDVPPGANPDLIGQPGPNGCAEIQVSAHSPAE